MIQVIFIFNRMEESNQLTASSFFCYSILFHLLLSFSTIMDLSPNLHISLHNSSYKNSRSICMLIKLEKNLNVVCSSQCETFLIVSEVSWTKTDARITIIVAMKSTEILIRVTSIPPKREPTGNVMCVPWDLYQWIHPCLNMDQILDENHINPCHQVSKIMT